MKYAIGIDIGGTKISMVIGNRAGKILRRRVMVTRTGRQTAQGIQELLENIKTLIAESPVKKSQILGIGVGIPGPVDTQKGIVPLSPHLRGWRGLRLREIISRKLGLPVLMANDANAAVVGEKIFGGGRGLHDFIYMTISTGIGGGIVANGALLEGASFVAGEVGHMTIVAKGDLCKCGKQGCLEAYASGTAIAAYAASEMKRGRASQIKRIIPKGSPIAARWVGLAARQGDSLALETYRRAGFYLGIGIANLLNILNPEKVFLGGGVLKSAPPVFWQSMLTGCRREAWPEAMKAVKITRTRLGDHVGELGALALVFERP